MESHVGREWRNKSSDGNISVSSSSPNYRVVETDYENYAIVYNCKSILGFLKTGDRFYWQISYNFVMSQNLSGS